LKQPELPRDLPDVHARPDARGIPLAEVGVRDVPTQLTVIDPEASHGPALTHLSLSVALPAERRAAHLSRLGEAVWALGERVALADLPELCHKLAVRLEAPSARLEGRFSLLVRREAPVTRSAGLVEIPCGFSASWSREQTSLRQRLTAQVQSLCPCSKEMSEKGAHNQRCRVQVDAESKAGLPYLKLLEAVEASGSCQLFPVLKRPDEKWVTEQAYAHPAFVEDIARELAQTLGRLPSIGATRVEVQSQESIHPHDAYAIAETR